MKEGTENFNNRHCMKKSQLFLESDGVYVYVPPKAYV